MDTEGVTVILIGWMTTSRDNTAVIPIGGGVRVRSSTKTTSGMKMLDRILGKMLKLNKKNKIWQEGIQIECQTPALRKNYLPTTSLAGGNYIHHI